jgi:4-diphosphocytidyl-2-C-methyl-D-erythritol kinase
MGTRADDYHELATLFQSISLYDTLLIERLPSLTVEVRSKPEMGIAPADNLVTRAAELILEEADSEYGARIELQKQIPISAGLGGGSSDAAATLVVLNELFQFEFHHEELKMMAFDLGSDVPFFVEGGLCWGRGRGEILEKWPSRFSLYHFVLLVPSFGLDSKEVYAEYDKIHGVGSMLDGSDALSFKSFPSQGYCENDLEPIAIQLRPELQRYRDLVVRSGADLYGMSGSGPTYFAAFAQLETAQVFMQQAQQELGAQAFLCRPTDVGQSLIVPAESPRLRR